MQQQPPQKKIRWLPAAIRKYLGKDFEDSVERTAIEYSDAVTTTSLTGNGIIGARSRQLIYAKYQQMSSDPLVSGAIRLHVTAALGGHETSGDLVFIECKPEFKNDAGATALVKELSAELAPIFNRVAIPAAYNSCIYGDSYARLYTKERVGLEDMSIDELLLPPLVIPYEQGNKTRVCVVATGKEARQKLAMDQIARVKLPRMIYTPQPMAVEKAWRVAVGEDDMSKLPLMPGLVGGSMLADAEQQYNNFAAALNGIVGQRILDSIDESIFVSNVAGMTKEQQQKFLTSVVNMLSKSKQVADDAVKSGRPVLQRIRHMIPVWNEKQVMSVQGVNSAGGTGTGRAGSIGIEDVMFHAKLLCGALGIDISMLGFADLMSGGLGDGGFFRTSAQAAERSRTIRVALSDFFNDCIDVHLIKKTGGTYDPKDRPWQVQFYGTISALETERTKTQLDSMNAGQMLAQCFALVKDAGLDEKAMTHMFETVMKIDAEAAKMYAASIVKAKKEADAKEAAQGSFGGGGGFPGSGGDDEDGSHKDPLGDESPSAGAPKGIKVGSK